MIGNYSRDPRVAVVSKIDHTGGGGRIRTSEGRAAGFTAQTR